MNKKYLFIGLAGIAIILTAVVFFWNTRTGSDDVGSATTGLPASTPTETVELKNGDTYNLTARAVTKEINGTTFRMLAYNGSIPGPLIKVTQGSSVTINFHNATDMKTLLHAHGVRMENAFDGAQTVQREMAPGESFAYTLTFPDAGMFWYHPHVREDIEQELGLYGNIQVIPNAPHSWSTVNREVPLFLDDILIESRRINQNMRIADHTLMGRFGNVMLTNGVTDYALTVQRDEVVRFFMTNAANTRPFNVGIEGAMLKRVGADNGLYEKDEWKENVILGPSERAIVEVLFDRAGTFAIQNKTPEGRTTLGRITVTPDPVGDSYAKDFSTLREHPETIESIEPFRASFEKAPDKLITLTLDMGGNMMNMPDMGHGAHQMQGGGMMGGSMMAPGPDGIEWNDTNPTMNRMTTTDSIQWKIVDDATGKSNMGIDWSFKEGDQVKIRIFNDPNSMHPMQHPIHVHGQRFLVLAENGKQNTNLVWKDSALVPSGVTMDILLDASNPGEWMAHCHIAEHLEAGMMFAFSVVPRR